MSIEENVQVVKDFFAASEPRVSDERARRDARTDTRRR
jgi:hypothetical protein